jgi:hypothetical protein
VQSDADMVETFDLEVEGRLCGGKQNRLIKATRKDISDHALKILFRNWSHNNEAMT